MVYPTPERLQFPLSSYVVTGRKFLDEAVFGGQSWGRHLGEDCIAEPGTPVCAIGDGDVVYAELHASWFRRRGNWGHVVILGHTHAADGQPFYSVYGHLGDFRVAVGNRVQGGDTLGTVGKGRTRSNGWWPEPHLHFAIYRGPWEHHVLPGYSRENDDRTKLEYWVDPSRFVQTYLSPMS
ncbi:MAG: M24/M37 family peptidase [Parcubacteria group bacterium Gr01-1014_38]|nr:MAG: M24/M37 family peptidase [Parcubacteria group bacterium Gr01-1014_38]